jgi:hypothetical protein
MKAPAAISSTFRTISRRAKFVPRSAKTPHL